MPTPRSILPSALVRRKSPPGQVPLLNSSTRPRGVSVNACIRSYRSTTAGTLTINNSTISGNGARFGYGGAIGNARA